MRLAPAPALLALLLATPLAAQPVEFYRANLEDPRVNVRGGVVAPGTLTVLSESSRPGGETSVRVVYSADGWRTTHSETATLTRTNAGPHGNDAEWRATIGPFTNGATVEYFVESTGHGRRTAINGTGFNGPEGENFVNYVWGRERAPAPARPGEIINVELDKLRSSQGWLFRSRGHYSPTEVWGGQPKIPIVYWVNWTAEPHWALANDGNHRSFDAWRQGNRVMKARVVAVPDYYVWPARHRFLDQPVFADADTNKERPIGTARDFFGAGRPEAFAARRRGAAGPTEPVRLAEALVGGTFNAVRGAALERLAERRAASASQPSVLRNLDLAGETLRGLRLVTLPTNDVVAERRGSRVVVSNGLLNAIDRLATERAAPEARRSVSARLLGLVLAHEVAHASGLRSERLADAESTRLLGRAEGLGTVRGERLHLSPAEVRASLDLFRGSPDLAGLRARFADLLRHGTNRARAERILAADRGVDTDRLSAWRRADGTLEWKRMLRERGTAEAAGLAHFGLALFLKELAVVAQTGDRDRIEEFFDGLATTDFYTHYGLFVVGARAGDVAYGRFLARYVRPRFVSTILRTNLTLAAGLALPGIVDGTFTGRAFAVSLTSLGLSSAAVKSGVRGLSWVASVSGADSATLARRLGLGARAVKLTAWVYTAVELAVVLYVADELGARMDEALAKRDARRALADAGEAFLANATDPNATPADVRAAAEAYHEAWRDHRAFLTAPLTLLELELASKLEDVARDAKLLADRRADALERVDPESALGRAAIARHGSLEAYAAALTAGDEAKLAENVDRHLARYAKRRAEALAEVYDAERRGHDLLDGLPHREWLLAGGRDGASGDPYGERSDLLARFGRGRLRGHLRDALGDGSFNRLETYDDERAVLDAVRASLESAGRNEHVATIDEHLASLEKVEATDRELAGEARGAASALDRVGR